MLKKFLQKTGLIQEESQNPVQPVNSQATVQAVPQPVNPNPQVAQTAAVVPGDKPQTTQVKIEGDTVTKDIQKIIPKITKTPFSKEMPQREYKAPPTVLLVLDGWGIGPNNAGNAVTIAKTPNLDNLWMSIPHTQLTASGVAVGLPQGADGNTETGHLNIGAGTIIYQELARIDNSIKDKTFAQNKVFMQAFAHVKKHNSRLHLMGLTGQGTVHSNLQHLYALLEQCKKSHLNEVYVHCFTDGRDSPPTTGAEVVKEIDKQLKKAKLGKVASVSGRFYAMDRDKKWDRIENTYHCLTMGTGQCVADPVAFLKDQYKQKITDEFIPPTNVCDDKGQAILIQDNDAVIFFNFRVDRPRELTRAFVMPDFEKGIVKEDYDPHIEEFYKTSLVKVESAATFQRQKILQNLYFVTMTTYEDNLPVEVAFPMQEIKSNVGGLLAQHGIRQLRITETEKERFVTTYLNAKAHQPNPGEEWIIYPSKGVKAYDEVPAMSTLEIAATMIDKIRKNQFDNIIANICNGDMIGHTGNLQACIKACEIVDQQVGLIVNEVLAQNGTIIVTADHGNVEEVINNETGAVDTEHSIYPVPFIIVNNKFKATPTVLPNGILADIVPTMLHLMGINKSQGMTGRNLFNLSL